MKLTDSPLMLDCSPCTKGLLPLLAAPPAPPATQLNPLLWEKPQASTGRTRFSLVSPRLRQKSSGTTSELEPQRLLRYSQ